MEDLSFLVNPRRKSRKGGKRRAHRRMRRNPELMLINPRRRKTSRRRKYRSNPVEAMMNPPKLSAAIRKQIRSYRKPTKKRKRGRMKVATVAGKLHVSRGSVIKYEHPLKRKKKRKKAKRKYTRKTHGAKAGGRKNAGRKKGGRKPRRHAKRLGGMKRSRTVYIPIKVSRVKRGRKQLFYINEPQSLKDIRPMAVNALWTALGFIGARLAGNFLKKILPVAFLKNDLIAHAILPVALTALKIKLPNKAALLSGAYLSWVLKALGLVLPENIKGMLGQGTYYYDQDYSLPWFAESDAVLPDWASSAWPGRGPQTLIHQSNMSPGVDADGSMGLYTDQIDGMGLYQPVDYQGLGVYTDQDSQHFTPQLGAAVPVPDEPMQFGTVDMDVDGE